MRETRTRSVSPSVTQPRRKGGLAVAGLFVVLAGGLQSGCIVAAIVGGAVESYRESSTRTVDAEYTGLQDKTFAVVVTADRAIQSDHPGVVAVVTDRVNSMLYANAQANGYIPSQTIMTYLLNRPQWIAKPMGELAADLGVDRLVYIELNEFRLTEPGNEYLWSGVASGTVGVVEADGPLPDDFAFSRDISVPFPDQRGFGPADMSAQLVASALVQRFTDRAAWLFYSHEEPYEPTY